MKRAKSVSITPDGWINWDDIPSSMKGGQLMQLNENEFVVITSKLKSGRDASRIPGIYIFNTSQKKWRGAWAVEGV